MKLKEERNLIKKLLIFTKVKLVKLQNKLQKKVKRKVKKGKERLNWIYH